MKKSLLVLVAVVVLGLALRAESGKASADGEAAKAGKGAKAFERGLALIKKSNMKEALKAFGEALQVEEDNMLYRQEYMLLRRAISLGDAMAEEKDQDRWMGMASWLSNYYFYYGADKALFPLAKKLHQHQKTEASAVMLAEAHMALGRYAKAEAVLTAMPADKLASQGRAVLGIALARQKKMDAARQSLKQVKPAEQPGTRILFDIARLQVQTGDVAGGLKRLSTAFELTHPGQLAWFKGFAGGHRDFAAVAKHPLMKQALATASKMQVSACSGGASCSSCSQSSTCPSKAGQNEKACGSAAGAGGCGSCSEAKTCPKK